MNIKELSLRHYFRVQPLKCIIVSGDINNFLTMKTCEAVEFNNHVIKGDPVIFGTLTEVNDVKINGGNIISINEKDGTIIVSPDKSFIGSEKREFERYPVSLLGYIKNETKTPKGSYIYIKDISYSGLRFYSTAELEFKDTVQLELYLHENVLNIEGTILRKSVSYGRTEYAIHFIFRTQDSIYNIREYLDKLAIIEKRLLLKHLVCFK